MTPTSTRDKLSKLAFHAVARDYAADLRLRGLSANTIHVYERTLRYLRDWLVKAQASAELRMQDVTTPRVKAYLEHRIGQKAFERHPGRPAEERPVSAYTIHQLVRSFRTFGRWLTKNGYDDPFASLQPGKLPEHLIDVLSEAEITTLFGVDNPATHHGARWQAILAFCLDIGVRVNELVNLELKRLDLENLRAKVLGKGNKERWVRLPNRTQPALSRYLSLFRQTESPFVFATLDVEPGRGEHGQEVSGTGQWRDRWPRIPDRRTEGRNDKGGSAMSAFSRPSAPRLSPRRSRRLVAWGRTG